MCMLSMQILMKHLLQYLAGAIMQIFGHFSFKFLQTAMDYKR
jgi:hypothetical protein